MLPRLALFSRQIVLYTVRRNIGVTAPCLQTAMDPIQKLFVDKIRDYSIKSKTAGGKALEMNPEMEKSLHDELEKLARQYGSQGTDFTKFPNFSFADPDLEPVGLQIDPSKFVHETPVEEQVVEEEDKAYFEY